MKRKPKAKSDTVAPESTDSPSVPAKGVRAPIVAPEILAAEISTDTRRAPARVAAPAVAKCVVCGSDSVIGSPEQLCWVCRRLKISAWRESEQQVSVQE